MSGAKTPKGPGRLQLVVSFKRLHDSQVRLVAGAENDLAAGGTRAPTRRPAHVARVLALAHRLRKLVDEGEVGGCGDLARMLEISQPRVTQLLNMTYLAPAIQAEIVALEAVDGVEPVTERFLREVLREVGWVAQMRLWRRGLESRTRKPK